MNKLLNTILLLLPAIGVLGGTFLSQSCATTGTGQKLEAMSLEDFQSMSLRVELVTRALLGRLVKDGKVSGAQVTKVADVVDQVLADPNPLTIGSGLVSHKLREQGWTNDEALLAVMLVEDLVRKYGGIGDLGVTIGPHGRALLTTISTALRQSVAGATPAEVAEAEHIIKAAGATATP